MLVNQRESWLPEGMDFQYLHGFIGSPQAAELPELRAYFSLEAMEFFGPNPLLQLGEAQRNQTTWRHVNMCSPLGPCSNEVLMATLARADVALLLAPGTSAISKRTLQETVIAARTKIPTIFLVRAGDRASIPIEIARQAFVIDDPFPTEQTWYLSTEHSLDEVCQKVVHALKIAGDRQGSVFSFARPSSGQILKVKDTVVELFNACALDPNLLFQTSPRQFEEFVAELLSRSGFQDVRLTSISRDGGRDVIAALNHTLGKTVTYVECKRYAPSNPVGIEVVQRIAGVIQGEAHHGAVVTTSRFTKPALEFAEPRSHSLSLRDFDSLQEWLKPFASYIR